MRLQHVSIAIPPDGAERARAFYTGILGLEETEVLPALDPARFIWFRVGAGRELHLLLNDEAPPVAAHFCLAVDDVGTLRESLEGLGVETRDSTPIIGRPRFTCRDPFGNLIELAQVAE